MSKSLTNTVTVEYTYAGYTGKPLTTSCYVTNEIIHAGVNAVKSTCKKQIGPNENIYYIINASFFGTGRNNVKIIDTIPVGLIYNNDAVYRINSGTENPVQNVTNTGQQYTFPIGNVAVNSIVTLTFSVHPADNVKPSDTDCFENQAFIIYDGITIKNGIPTNTVTNCYSYSDLTVTKNGPEEANCGDNLLYTITIENSGNLPVNNVQVSDNFHKPDTSPKFIINTIPPENTILDIKIDGMQIQPASYTYINDLLTITGLTVPGATYNGDVKTNGQTIVTISGTVHCPNKEK